MTSIGVPIHCDASEPEIDAFRIAARPASNAATHASRVSRSVPSMSKRTARSLGTSRLLLAEPPDLVAHRDLHAELIPESTEKVRCFLPAESRAPTDLQGH